MLRNEDPLAQWRLAILTMSPRIAQLRGELQTLLEADGNEGEWSHITDQAGMFCYTGPKAE